jgi:hypothetical protein
MSNSQFTHITTYPTTKLYYKLSLNYLVASYSLCRGDHSKKKKLCRGDGKLLSTYGYGPSSYMLCTIRI